MEAEREQQGLDRSLIDTHETVAYEERRHKHYEAWRVRQINEVVAVYPKLWKQLERNPTSKCAKGRNPKLCEENEERRNRLCRGDTQRVGEDQLERASR